MTLPNVDPPPPGNAHDKIPEPSLVNTLLTVTPVLVPGHVAPSIITLPTLSGVNVISALATVKVLELTAPLDDIVIAVAVFGLFLMYPVLSSTSLPSTIRPVPFGLIPILPFTPSAITIVPVLVPSLVDNVKSPVPYVVTVALAF